MSRTSGAKGSAAKLDPFDAAIHRWVGQTRGPAGPGPDGGLRLTPGWRLLVVTFGYTVFGVAVLWWIADKLRTGGDTIFQLLLVFAAFLFVRYIGGMLLRLLVYRVAWTDGRLFLRHTLGRRVEHDASEVLRIDPPARNEEAHTLVFHDGSRFPLMLGFNGLDDLFAAIGKRPPAA